MGVEPLDVFLVRHGRTDWNEEGRLMGRCDVGLNPRGRVQAKAAAAALRQVSLSRVIASPQQRAQETARIIAEPHGLAPESDADLAEVWVCDSWQGKTFAELWGDPDLKRYVEDPTFESDLIESAAAVQQRVVRAFERLQEETRDASVALVSHGDPLRLLLAHFLHMELKAYRQLLMATGSISRIMLGQYRSQLVTLNWHTGGLADAFG